MDYLLAMHVSLLCSILRQATLHNKAVDTNNLLQAPHHDGLMPMSTTKTPSTTLRWSADWAENTNNNMIIEQQHMLAY